MINKIRKSGLLLIIFDILIITGSYILSLYILNYNNLSDNVVLTNILFSIFVYQFFLNIFKMYLNLVNYEVGKDYLKYIICSFLSMATRWQNSVRFLAIL